MAERGFSLRQELGVPPAVARSALPTARAKPRANPRSRWQLESDESGRDGWWQQEPKRGCERIEAPTPRENAECPSKASPDESALRRQTPRKIYAKKTGG